MKAIFMVEIGGRLMEVERADITPTPVFYRAVRDPIELRAIISADIPQAPIAKREAWVCQSMPITEPGGFAVYLLDSVV